MAGTPSILFTPGVLGIRVYITSCNYMIRRLCAANIYFREGCLESKKIGFCEVNKTRFGQNLRLPPGNRAEKSQYARNQFLCVFLRHLSPKIENIHLQFNKNRSSL